MLLVRRSSRLPSTRHSRLLVISSILRDINSSLTHAMLVTRGIRSTNSPLTSSRLIRRRLVATLPGANTLQGKKGCTSNPNICSSYLLARVPLSCSTDNRFVYFIGIKEPFGCYFIFCTFVRT